MSDHLVEMVSDFWGCHWAECSCGWRSVRSIYRQDAEKGVERHRADLAFEGLMRTASDVAAAAIAARKRGDQ